MPSPRAYVHIGTPKTGTTFLQRVLWRGKDQAKSRGLLLPGNQADHHHAAFELTDRPGYAAAGRDAVQGAWKRLLEQIALWDGDVLVTSESFAPARAEQASRGIEDLADTGREVHVLVTARDLARQIPAEWQQRVRSRSPYTFSEFMQLISDPSTRVYRDFWANQDIADISRRWLAALPVDQRHIITVPPRGRPKDLLWRRFATVIAIEPQQYDLNIARANNSLGPIQIELMRLLNCYFRENPSSSSSLKRTVNRFYAFGALTGRATEPLELGGPDLRFARDASEKMLAELNSIHVTVTGDIDELLIPQSPLDSQISTPRRNPDESELLRESVAVTAALLEKLDELSVPH